MHSLVKVGMGVILAGQVGLVGHITIGDGARVAAQSGIMSDVEPGAVLMGSPARTKGEFLRTHAAVGRLPGLLRRVAELEKKLEELQKKA